MNDNILLRDILIMIIFSAGVILLLAARVENLMACRYIEHPYTVQGKIKELCKATFPARRETRYSGFDYVIAEYEWDAQIRTVKLMRTKQDYETRVIELVIDKEQPDVAVRREYETPNDVAVRYFVGAGFFLATYVYGDFLRNVIEALLLGVVIYYFRKPLILHILDKRKDEWQGTSSVVAADGSISPRVVIMVFVMCILFFIVFMWGFLLQW